MAGKDSVSKQTLYIAVAISLVVGGLGGIIFSSVQSDSYVPPQRQVGSPSGVSQGQGIDPQQASQILALEQRVTANPQDVDAWTQLGNVYFDAGRSSKAIRAYNKSLAIRPADANVLTDLGVMYRRNGQAAEAVSAFDRAIAASPQVEQAHFNKGIVLMYDLGDVDGAVAAWEELLKMNPAAVSSNGIPISKVIADAKAGVPSQGQ